MRKGVIVSLLVSALWSGAWAQTQRQFSVWESGVQSDYQIVNMDSLTFHADGSMLIYAMDGNDTLAAKDVDSVTFRYSEFVSTNLRDAETIRQDFDAMSIKSGSAAYKPVDNYKRTGGVEYHHNPLMGHKFGADPFGMVDGDRLYVYMTDDHLYTDKGEVITEGYADIRNISIISSDDLVNWTDHGAQPIAGNAGPANWANNSWAPCAAHKRINGKEQYFLYFADNGSGIGVVQADSPWGPWKLPYSGMKQLISRGTNNCGDVTWLFDPAILMDGKNAYLYFGGGVPDGKDKNPGTARCVKLASNMTAIVGSVEKINPPYLFEDSGINKVGGKYLYSYCANWSGNQAANGGPGTAKIGYMVSDNPLGPFTYVGSCFDNPGDASWSGGGGNNHHAIVEFQGKYYILYHTRTLKSAMRNDAAYKNVITNDAELRSTCISEIKVNESNATITHLSASQITEAGVTQLKNFDPYRTVPGATMAWEYKVTTSFHKGSTPDDTYCAAHLQSGSWMCLSNVDFKHGPVGFTAVVKGKGSLKICGKNSGKSGTVYVLADIPESNDYVTITVPVYSKPEDVVNLLYLVASDELSIRSWSFF